MVLFYRAKYGKDALSESDGIKNLLVFA